MIPHVWDCSTVLILLKKKLHLVKDGLKKVLNGKVVHNKFLHLCFYLHHLEKGSQCLVEDYLKKYQRKKGIQLLLIIITRSNMFESLY